MSYLPQKLDILLAAGFAKDVPVLCNQLCKFVNGVGDGECREHEWEPAIGSTKQNCARLFVAFRFGVGTQMGMATIACREVLRSLVSEGVGHTSLLAAGLTEHLDIRGFA